MHGCLGQLWAARDADVSGPHRKMLSPVGGGRLCQAPEHDGTPPGGYPRRPRDPAAQARRYGLTERELVAITEVVVADYNSRGHRGQAGISPLECLRQYANAEGGLLRRIEPSRRHRLSVFVR